MLETHYRFHHYSDYALLSDQQLRTIEAELMKNQPAPNKLQKTALTLLNNANQNASLEALVCGYFVDILLPDKKTIIELDGDQHYTNNGLCIEDRLRDELLRKSGCTIYRFKNKEIETEALLRDKLTQFLNITLSTSETKKASDLTTMQSSPDKTESSTATNTNALFNQNKKTTTVQKTKKQINDGWRTVRK